MSGSSRFDDASRFPVWRQGMPVLPECPALTKDTTADLAIIGGGFVGLWSALKARERWPDARIVLIEANRCGEAASGRNGGFCAPSISHGVSNAVARWPREAEDLVRMGRQNLDALEADLEIFGIDAEFQRSGKLNLAAKSWQADGLRSMKELYAAFGVDTQLLMGEALAERLNSPHYVAGLFEPNYALVHPGKLVAGLRAACLALGVAIHENTRVTSIERRDGKVHVHTPEAILTAPKVALATNADVPLLRRLRPTILPVFDCALVTEPLSDEQLRAIGWVGQYGIADSGNQFHYSRKTADNRVLWGGFDAIYHRGARRDPDFLDREQTFATLQANFSAAFPALADVRFDYRWGGIIDVSARMTFFAGTAFSGQVAYALGFTGQGVSASRFAALTILDLLENKRTERTSLQMLRRRPVPFPPEPFCDMAVRWTQRDLAHEDETGQRSRMLRTFDWLGVGFAS